MECAGSPSTIRKYFLWWRHAPQRHRGCGRLAREGFNDQASVEGYRAFTSFLLGHLLLEVAVLGADLGPLDVLEEDAEKSLAPYPNVRRLSEPLRENHAGVEFEDSLEDLLQRLALIRSES